MLVVRFTGWDVAWALRRGVRVPLHHVTGTRIGARAEELRTLSLRLGGTYLPGVIAAGLYRSKGGGRQLWSVRRAAEVLVINLRDERWDRLILEVPDPAATAALIEAARGG